MIEFDHVDFAHPGGPGILRDFSLHIEAGEAVALVGRSGAGKSTALKLVNGVLQPDAGQVRVGGRETRQWDPYLLRRSIGYVLQDVGLFPHRTVAPNVAVVPELLQWAPDRIRARVDELLDLVGLPPATFRERWPHELSGGQRQRVGLARALAADPSVLLLDEPFGALDPITRHEVRTAFLAIQSRLSKTVLLVTHDMREAMLVGARVGVLFEGRLHTCVPPGDLLRDPDPAVRPLLEAAGVA
jgi:osmoprotectant transport system ATP-binding protein